MFIDKARIYIRAGDGGDGCLSFRREKFVPFGGPNGGDGGSGGDVYLVAAAHMTTLFDFTYRPHFIAQNGGGGLGKDMHGKNGEDLYVKVPCGTQVYKVNENKGRISFADLVNPDDRLLVAKGGSGGRGNARFKTQYNRAPRISEKGQTGEKVTIDLELKLIADVGLVGYPNAGKSTFLSSVTSAKPKIAAYPFTTLSPNLGVCAHKNRTFVIADIPGLIEDAHKGRGLGIEFLRHIERTKVILHIVDVFGSDGKPAWKNFMLINRELARYSKKLVGRPMIAVLNKIDLTDSQKYVKLFKPKIKNKKLKIFPVSAATGKDNGKLLDEVVYQLSVIQKEESIQKEKTALQSVQKLETKNYIIEPEFGISMEGDNVFVVTGKRIEKMVAMTNFSQEEAVERLQYILKKMGIERALLKKGIKQGDLVKVGVQEFNFKS